jgi:two-component system, OmpR family, sensor kinase
VTIRARLVIMVLAAFVVVLLAGGAAAMLLLQNRLIDDLDQSLLDRRAGIERLVGLLSRELLGDIASQPPQIGGSDLALVTIASDGSVNLVVPSGPPEDPDPPPIVSNSDIAQLRAGGEPFTVESESDGYRVTGVVLDEVGTTVILGQPLDDVARTMRSVLLVFSIVGAVVTLVLGGAIWLLIRGELRPLYAMAETADRIYEGDLSQRVAIERPSNEVGRLGGALNSMLGRIEEAVAATTESENRMRRFIADASHELRTPLTSIRGYAELYRTGADSPEYVARSFDRIAQEATRMGGLVEDLVLLARLDQERPLTNERVDMAAVAHDVVADAAAVEPHREMTLQVGEGQLVVEGDADRLRQVLTNLLGNVRKHTTSGTPAKVSLERVDAWVIVSVADDGDGMNPEAAAHAFERFYQASPDRTTPGSGLGLAIVRSIVERHGGTVELASVVGIGTEVTFRLPALASRE